MVIIIDKCRQKVKSMANEYKYGNESKITSSKVCVKWYRIGIK